MQVEQHDVRFEFREDLLHMARVVQGPDLAACALEDRLEKGEVGLLVVDDQDLSERHYSEAATGVATGTVK